MYIYSSYSVNSRRMSKSLFKQEHEFGMNYNFCVWVDACSIICCLSKQLSTMADFHTGNQSH